MSTIIGFLSSGFASKIARFYILGVMIWAAIYFLAGDRILYFEFINALAVYFFVPLPFIFAYSWRRGNRFLMLANVLMLVVFLSLWGPLFVRNGLPQSKGDTTIKVMTYNLQGNAGDVRDSIEAIRAEDADIVMLQEVTFQVADALQASLTSSYPWQNLDPRAYASGMGILSKLPLEALHFDWLDRWNGWPQVVQVEVGDQKVTFINVHLHASRPTLPSLVEKTAANRERNATTLLDVIAQVSLEGPVILAGDFNVTHLSSVYKTITTKLDDAWMSAGFGFGHTFPADADPPGLLAWKRGFPVPQKIVRIDYIFHSSELIATEAYRGANFGGSDHRAVVTLFELLDKKRGSQ